MVGSISFLGFGSGQDFNKIVDALVEARKTAYIKPLEDRKANINKKLDTVGTVDSAMSAFYSTLRGMDRVNELMVRSASSSDENVLTASADSNAAINTHTITVNQLAQAATEVHHGIQNDLELHNGVTDQTASINDSGSDKTFSYSYNGTTSTITVNSGDSLQDLMNDINNASDNPGVTASIVTSNGYDHLVLSETDPDPSLSITIDPDNDMTMNGSDGTTDFTASSFKQTINASGTDKVFQFRYGDNSPVNLTVVTGSTLEDLKNLINASNAGVNASILNDGGTGSGSQHLVLSGDDTGSDYSIVMNPDSGTTLDGTGGTEDFSNASGVFQETQAASNAQIRLDGYPSSGWIERSTNRISDLIEGLSINLSGTGSSVVGVAVDTDAVVEKIQEFKDAFNKVRTAIKDATKYDTSTGEAGSLIGDASLQIIKSRLDNLVSNVAPGFSDPDDVYTNIEQIGFSTDTLEGSETEGLLKLDTSKLEDALKSNPDAVVRLFSSYFDGVTDDSRISFASSLDTATPGVYQVEVDTDNERGRFKLNNGDWGDWVSLAGSSGNYSLTGMSGPEAGIALNITYAAGTGTHTAELRLRNGIATSMGSEMSDLMSSSGPISSSKKNYNDVIDGIDERIAAEEDRLTLYEDMLKKRFAQLDAYMSRMTQISQSFSSMVPKQE